MGRKRKKRRSHVHDAAVEQTPVPATVTGIGGFRVVPVPLSETNSTIRHYLYFKQHRSKAADSSGGHSGETTLFVANLPAVHATETLRAVFGVCGKVSSVDTKTFEHQTKVVRTSSGSKKRKMDPSDPLSKTVFALGDFSETHASESRRWGALAPPVEVAYVVFKRPKSVKKALKLDWMAAMEEHKEAILDAIAPKEEAMRDTSVAQFAVEYVKHMVPADEKAINAWMANWQSEENQRQLDTAMASLKGADEDGWTTVTAKGSSRRVAGGGVGVVTRTRQKPKTMDTSRNFYNFQEHQRQKESVEAVRLRFQAEKKKIEQMKKERKFKPM